MKENHEAAVPEIKISKILKSLLEKNDMTVVQLARKAGVPKNTIFNWLSGMKPKDCEQIFRVANVFSVTLDYLLFGVEKSGEALRHQLNEEVSIGTFEVILKKAPQGSSPIAS